MSLQTWWIGVQLERTENKLRRFRFMQKQNREAADRLEQEHKKGMVPGAYEAKKAKLDSKREKLTHEVSLLATQEDSLKDRLEAQEREGGNAAA